MSYTFLWVRSKELDNLYAHPIDGLNAVVDIKANTVIHVDDWGGPPIPLPESNYDRVFLDETKVRTDLKPIHVTQPEGVSFRFKGRTLEWHNWSLLIGFTGREGITLHNIRYSNRPVCYRASLAEMVVPYGSPRPPHYRKNVFDIGEYGLGKLANSLELGKYYSMGGVSLVEAMSCSHGTCVSIIFFIFQGCDCLGSIQYLDGHIIDMEGNVMTIPNAICIHEEDHGVLWKHWDFRTDRTEVRRARRLVVSSISTVGNYEYGSYWYLYLDGTIEYEMKATGIINTVACDPGQPEKYGTEVSPGVVGQIHQHHFCARLDMSVDGDQNTVVECDTVAEPLDAVKNPYGNAYYVQSTPLTTEGGRPRNPTTERYWKFTNPNQTNHVGTPTSYKLEPGDTKQVFVDPNTPSGKRMGWCYNALWVTPYDAEERFPTGEYVNQSDGQSDGLTKYVQQERSIDNTDVVAWHTFGLHHPVRPEDFPVQNCVNVGFKLCPAGFFDKNPNIDDMPLEKNRASVHAGAVTAPQAACTGGCHDNHDDEDEEKKE